MMADIPERGNYRFFPDGVTLDYGETKRAIARKIAELRNEQLNISHYNEAAAVLWPLLSLEDQSRAVLR
jgi:hypothetical protein